MKTDIKKELFSLLREQEETDKVKDDLVKQLVAISDVPIPEILVADQSKSIEQDFTNNLMYQEAVTLDQYLENKGFKSKEDWEKSEVHDIAVKRVQAGLVLAELSKIEKIEATESELEANIIKDKTQYANNPDTVKQFDLPEVQLGISPVD